MVGTIVVVLHVISVFMLVSGSVGRNLIWMHVRNSKDLDTAQALELAENSRPGSCGRARGWSCSPGYRGVAAGWPILGFLVGAGSNWVLAALALYLTFIPLVTLLFIPKWKIRQRALEGALARARSRPSHRGDQRPGAVPGPRLRAGDDRGLHLVDDREAFLVPISK